MRITVTGGTGFVGSHTVAALVAAGHEVRLFVRSRERVGPALEPLGITAALETIEGDVTDPSAVERAVSGVDAVVHAASVYSLDPRDAERIARVNVSGTQLVIEAAVRAGASRIVHVSSIVALFGEKHATLTPETGPGHPVGAYMRSKADSERVARELRAAGAPVLISYPGMVWGPHDPYVGETCQLTRNALRGLLTLMPGGTMVTSDVRDVAALHAALVERATPPAAYLAPSHTVTTQEIFGALAAATGRRVPVLGLPAPAVLPMAWAAELVQPLLPFRQPFTYAGGWALARRHRCDDSATRRDFGLQPRPFDESVADTVRWMAKAGHLSARQAGRLAAA